MAIAISLLAANAGLDAITALINAGGAGAIKIYTGSAPATPETAASGTLLATLPMSATSFGAAASAVATANSITNDSNIDATGTAAHFRIYANGGSGNCILQGTVSTSGADLNFNSVAFVAGGTCAISSMTLTDPTGA